MHDFDLARRYFERARQAGAADEVVTIGMANSAIAEGRTSEAQSELAKLGDPAEFADNFDYTMAQANIYRQQHQHVPGHDRIRARQSTWRRRRYG